MGGRWTTGKERRKRSPRTHSLTLSLNPSSQQTITVFSDCRLEARILLSVPFSPITVSPTIKLYQKL